MDSRSPCASPRNPAADADVPHTVPASAGSASRARSRSADTAAASRRSRPIVARDLVRSSDTTRCRSSPAVEPDHGLSQPSPPGTGVPVPGHRDGSRASMSKLTCTSSGSLRSSRGRARAPCRPGEPRRGRGSCVRVCRRVRRRILLVEIGSPPGRGRSRPGTPRGRCAIEARDQRSPRNGSEIRVGVELEDPERSMASR